MKKITTVDRTTVTLSTRWTDGRLLTVLRTEHRQMTVCAVTPHTTIDPLRRGMAATLQQKLATRYAERVAKYKTVGELGELLTRRLQRVHCS